MTSPPAACQRHRSSLSALLDGAATEAEAVAVHQHLRSCAACRSYRLGLDRLDRLVATSTAPAPPDLVPGLATAMSRYEPAPTSRAGSRRSIARHLLGATGGAQILLALPALLFGSGGGEVHDSRHLGAWALAFGVGLVLAAVQPRHARTLLPLAATLTVAVIASTVIDLASGHRAAEPEAVHLLDVVGLGLLALVHRQPTSIVEQPPPSSLSLAGGA